MNCNQEVRISSDPENGCDLTYAEIATDKARLAPADNGKAVFLPGWKSAGYHHKILVEQSQGLAGFAAARIVPDDGLSHRALLSNRDQNEKA